MKTPILTAALAAAIALSAAQAADPHAEIMEWVIEPCMEVAAALDVKKYDWKTIETGVKREHIAEVMAASRDATTRETISAKMKAGASWEDRRAAYPVMLRICLQQLPGMQG